MQEKQVIVQLTRSEQLALARIAATECRMPEAQMRFMLREEAQRRGLKVTAEMRAMTREEGDVRAAS